MTSEASLYAFALTRQLERLCQALDGLDGTLLNWRPAAPEANSMYVIATHVLGNAEAWVLGIACGQPIERDRPAEFAASGKDAAPIVARAHELARSFDEALAGLPDSALSATRPAPQILWGIGPAQPVTVREALMHVIEHASTHIGELHITRDLALASAKA